MESFHCDGTIPCVREEEKRWCKMSGRSGPPERKKVDGRPSVPGTEEGLSARNCLLMSPLMMEIVSRCELM